MPTGSEWVGAVLLLLWLAWLDRKARVSRNGASPSTTSIEPTTGTGPKWEQDVPYALTLLDEDEEPIFEEEDDW